MSLKKKGTKKTSWIKKTLKLVFLVFAGLTFLAIGFYFGFNAGYDTCLYLCLNYIESLGIKF